MKKYLIYIFFIGLIFNNSLKAQKLKKIGIEFKTQTYNFGDIQMWENQPAIFELVNKSNVSLSILPIFSENDLEVVYPDKSIAPNEKVIIKAIYYTSGTGSFTRKFPIYFDRSPEAYYLTIKGNIKSLSPTAYIQCPMAKPEHSKTKGDLVGLVVNVDTDMPIENAEVILQQVGSKTNAELLSDRTGNFYSKLPFGNYQVIVKKNGFETHNSFFYLGQNTGNLKIKLIPVSKTPLLSENIDKKEDKLNSSTEKYEPNKVENVSTPKTDFKKEELPKYNEESLSTKNDNVNAPIKNNDIDKIEDVNTPNENFVKQDLPKYNEDNLPKKDEPIASNTTNNTPEKVYTYTIHNTFEKPIEETPKQEQTETIPQKEEKIYKPYESAYYDKPKEEKEPKEVKDYGDFGYSTPEKKEIEKPDIQYENSTKYRFRFVNEDTYQPIPNVELQIKSDEIPTVNDKGSELGSFEIKLPINEYELTADAHNFLPTTITINPNDDTKVVRVYLKPTKEPEPQLVALNTTEKVVPEIIEKEEQKEVAPINEPTPTTTKVEENKIEDTKPQENDRKASLDSLQIVMAQIEAEKAKMELELAKANLEISKKENELLAKELELSKKDAEINNTNSQLEQTKQNYETQIELLKENTPENTTPKETSIELSRTEYAANNVLFLIDISSSMAKENKMELLKESIKNLTSVLRDIDNVSLIAYNQKTNVILEGISGADKGSIINAIDSLQNYGLTYGVRGLQTAYDLLNYHYIGNGNNQIILATDGLFSKVNALMTENELNKEVKKHVKEMGIKLSVIGFGQDEEGDKLMQKLAESGSGQYIKIKNPWEARTVLIDEIKLNSKKL